MAHATEDLGTGSVHLWQVDVGAATSEVLVSGYARLLSPLETSRQRRFLRPQDRHLFLVSHALVRTTLSRYAAVAPHDWEFESGVRGRPEISSPLNTGLRFNLSHTPGRAVCAVTRDRDVGVDVEHLSRVSAPLRIADRFFAPPEVEALRALPGSRQRQRFFELWTLKESYIKACGLGLAIPLDQFWFTDPDREPISISFAPQRGDDPTAWRFSLVERGPDYAVAVGIRHGSRSPLEIRTFSTIP